ncbi:MAG: TPM domain-containing protein [Tissierellia bacterium]|nr:TPM domain-containing protein [Tissierellia bacterium]
MVRLRKFIILFLFILLIMPANAANNKVIDNAGLFSNDELNQLEEKCQRLSKKYDMDFAIATTDDTKGLNTMMYTEKFYEDNGYGLNGDGIIIMYDMQNREIFINTEGKAIEKIDDAKIEKLLDIVFDNGLQSGDFYNSADAYLDKAEKYIRGNYISLVDIGIGAVGAIGAGGGYFSRNKAKYSNKRSPKSFPYMNNSISSFPLIADELINSRTETTRIPRNVVSTGGGSGGTSTRSSSTGSGRTYGGGGRKF